MAKEELLVHINARDGLTGPLNNAHRAASRLGGMLRTSLQVGVVAAAAAAFAGLTLAVKAGVDEFIESQKVTAQTQAVLSSTGGVANVTAGHIEDMATELRNLSGVDDEAIQAGENLLLTFTNIRNVGKNKIFDEATKSSLDMAVALGIDMTDAAMKVGKALNQPIQGVTALRRVGVQLSDQQLEQVKSFMAVNDIANAQKIILQELQKEFGGSAEAAGKTLSGQFAILKGKAEDFTGSLVTKMVPGIKRVLDSLGKMFEEMMKAPGIEKLFTSLGEAIGSILGQIAPLSGPILALFSAIANPLMEIVITLSNELLPVVMELGGIFGEIFEAVLPIITQVVDILADALKPILTAVKDIFVALKEPIKHLATALGSVLKALSPIIKVGALLIAKVFKALEPILPVLADLLTQLCEMALPFVEILAKILEKGMVFVGWIVDILGGALKGVISIFRDVAGFFKTAWDKILSVAKGVSKALHEVWIRMQQAFWKVVKGILIGVGAFVKGMSKIPLVGRMFKGAAAKVDEAVNGINNKLRGFTSELNKMHGKTGKHIKDVVKIFGNLKTEVTTKFKGMYDKMIAAQKSGNTQIINKTREQMRNQLDEITKKIPGIGGAQKQVVDKMISMIEKGKFRHATAKQLSNMADQISKDAHIPKEQANAMIEGVAALISGKPLKTSEVEVKGPPEGVLVQMVNKVQDFFNAHPIEWKGHGGGYVWHGGGPVMHGGGRMHGGGINERPAILERGEYVIQKRAAEKLGIRTLEALNRGKSAGDTYITINAGAYLGTPGDARRMANQINKYLVTEGAR